MKKKDKIMTRQAPLTNQLIERIKKLKRILGLNNRTIHRMKEKPLSLYPFNLWLIGKSEITL